ncbi:MAG: redoxin domain-containing protein [Phycisphaerales bacterium]|jgi:hypothetical protein|nr:redoxin domain-containing protein [Phycisphaerales bacterium]
MITARRLSLSFCAALSTILMAAAPTPPKPKAPPAAPQKAAVGLPAPGFTLTDTDGTQHALSDYAGKIVVLEWFNASCPFSGRQSGHAIHSTGKASTLRSQLRAIDPTITYLVVDSTARRNTREQVIDSDKKAKAQWKIDVPILIDYDGTVGRAFKAETTPHMFVIDAAGVLRYQGAFDNDQQNEKRATATNYVLKAVQRLKEGAQPTPDSVPAWGCSVKYKR